MMRLDRIPFFEKLETSRTVLLAGAGGGFDVYCALPLYYNLKQQGKKVLLANYAFTLLDMTSSEQVSPHCYRIRPGDRELSGSNYFPEKYLSEWLALQGEEADIFAFDRAGIQPLAQAYSYLLQEYAVDTVILVDGGTDSLMFGDEEGLGTPVEDICSMVAVHSLPVEQKFLLSVGFGVDHYHGVSHYHVLENIAELMRDGGYLGAFHLLPQMQEAAAYQLLMETVNQQMNGMESIVSNSIVSALEGNYGNYHKTARTKNSHLWINPLMTMYWCFELDALIAKNKYIDHIRHTHTIGELNMALSKFRRALPKLRKAQPLPM